MAKARAGYPDPGLLKWTAASDLENGQIVNVAGLLTVVEGLSGVKAGEPAAGRIDRPIYLPKASGTNFTAGDTAQFNFTTGLAVSSGGDTENRVITTPAAGATEVLVMPNVPAELAAS